MVKLDDTKRKLLALCVSVPHAKGTHRRGIHAGYNTQFSRQNVNASSFVKEVRLASENVEELYCSVCVFNF